MTAAREGYRNWSTQLTKAAFAALAADAEARGKSLTARLNEVLHQHYGIGMDEIPVPRRTGRKPKEQP